MPTCPGWTRLQLLMKRTTSRTRTAGARVHFRIDEKRGEKEGATKSVILVILKERVPFASQCRATKNSTNHSDKCDHRGASIGEIAVEIE